MAGTGQEIVAPEFLDEYRPDLVVAMNPIYVERDPARTSTASGCRRGSWPSDSVATDRSAGDATADPRRARARHVCCTSSPTSRSGRADDRAERHPLADRDPYDIRARHLLPDDEMKPAFLECGVPVTHLGHRPGSGLRTVVRLARLLRRDRIDIVHVHSDLDRKYAQAAAWAARVPVVGHLHAGAGPSRAPAPTEAIRPPTAPCQERRGREELRGAQRRRHYIAESTRVRDLFLPLVDAPITVLDQAIPIDRFDAALDGAGEAGLREELAIAPTATMLVNVSRLVAGKGHEDLLRAFAAVRAQAVDAVLVIVGDGDRRGTLEQLAAELDVTHAVFFTGSRDDVPEVLVAGDIFVFASESEGFGIAVLEAMAASLPVVAFGLPAFEEFAVDGVTAGSCRSGMSRGLPKRSLRSSATRSGRR